MAATSVLKVAAAPGGYCIRIEGRGTMRESHSAAQFAGRALSEPDMAVTADLSACEYLDSTFLGCLVDLHRRAGKCTPPRFRVVAPPDKVQKLLHPMRLELVLRPSAEAPQVLGEYVALPAAEPGSPDVMRHVMECHRLLAETGAPQKAAFAAIADSIERELAKGVGAVGKSAG
jgi:anti-anti-sigma regulatory factor